MSQPSGPLRPEEQDVVKRIGRALLGVVPQGWQGLRAEHRAVGKHVEFDLVVTGADGVPRAVRPPEDVVRLFGQLRTAMYRPGRGTWLSAVYVIEPPSAFNVEFEPDAEPRWRRPPPPVGFQDELFFFPRTEDRIPEWLRQRVSAPPRQPPAPQGVTPPRGMPRQAPPTPPGPMRTPRVYDRLDESGRPVINRPPLDPAERGRVLEYLETAPVVLAARSYDRDAFAPDTPPSVPMNFRTDGAWVWPGAVAYYLRNHGLAPDPELLAHIRGRQFAVPDVDDRTRDAAVAAVTGKAPAKN